MTATAASIKAALLAAAISLAGCAGMAQRFADGYASAKTRPPGGLYLPAVDLKGSTASTYDVDASECNALAVQARDWNRGIEQATTLHRIAVSRCMQGRGYSVLN